MEDEAGRNASLLKHSLRRLALQERFDETDEQIGLADDGGVRRRRHDGKTRARQRALSMSPMTPPPSSRPFRNLPAFYRNI
jgi:hypothetical protein